MVRVTISRDGGEVADVPMVQLLAALGIPYSDETAETVAQDAAEQQRRPFSRRGENGYAQSGHARAHFGHAPAG